MRRAWCRSTCVVTTLVVLCLVIAPALQSQSSEHRVRIGVQGGAVSSETMRDVVVAHRYPRTGDRSLAIGLRYSRTQAFKGNALEESDSRDRSWVALVSLRLF